MVSPVLSENFSTGDFLVSEAPNTGSRDVVQFDNTAGTADLLVNAGTVYSLENYAVPVATPKAGNAGNGTISAVSPNTTVTQIGVYLVTMLTATTFAVTAPDNSILNNGSSAAPYLDGIGFKYTPGGTPNVAGDTFTITIANGAAPTAVPGGANVGNGTIANVETVMAATAMLGNYTLTFTGATAFIIIAPDGRQLTAGAVGTPYEDELAFTITAGSNPYGIGDSITIGVSPGLPYATFWTGASPAAGIIYNCKYVPAGGTSNLTAIVMRAEVKLAELQYLRPISAAGAATVAAQLGRLGIVAR